MELDQNTVLIGMFVLMLLGILSGVHIGFAFGLTALLGNILLFGGMDGDWEGGFEIAMSGVGSVSYEYLRSEVFAAIPLFMLLGDFVNKSGSARDLYNLINHGLKKIPGRLAVATVAGNAVFAAVTGVSIAAAAAFSRIAYPQMRHYGYDRQFALGSVAGSACLGMIIPPSVLLIVWGIIAEKSIAQLFIAGAIPGLILAVFYMIYIGVTATLKPELAPPVSEEEAPLTKSEVASGFGIGALILVVLGGIWGGLFTPTEAGGVGAAAAMILGILKGMRLKQIAIAVVDSGKAAAPIMFLLLTANMYAKFMEAAGMSELIRETFETYDLGEIGIILVIIVIWLLLGMILDSISIILITVPIFAPITEPFFDPIAFGIFGILVIEAGLLTPPFGLLVYTVKGSVEDKSVKLSEIFKGSVPYWILMLLVMLIIWSTPEVATWLPSKMI
ncbi:MAG: TRAP transporter large permease subunit [Rhodospirillaceae bacterium]|jgi:C4-dicarboxylate transporter DctM subunit